MRRLLAAALGVLLLGCSPVPPPAPATPPATAPPAAPSPAPTPAIPAMTLEEKAGQVLTVGGVGSYLSEDSPGFRELARQVTELHVGGILWFRSKLYETAVLNERLQKLATVPLLISADLEAGIGMRFEDTTWGAPAMAIAATGDPSLAERRGRITAEEARALGVAHVYAPVADVNVNPDNPVINARSFGEDPADVARYVVATVKGIQDGGALATIKHFPGHGDTATDSHRSLPVLRFDRKRLDAVELVPFRAGIAAGARSVMVAHLAVPALDATPAPPLVTPERNEVFKADVTEVEAAGTLPATLSPALTDGLLRHELGFDGLVVTDSMSMGGLVAHFGAGEAAVRALLAGCDVVLHSPDPRAARDAIVDAVRSGRLSIGRLDRSVARIVAEKRRLGLFAERTPPLSRIASVVGTRAHEAVEEEIARRSLTLVREEPGRLPLDGSTRLVNVAVSSELGPVLSVEPISAALSRRAPGTQTLLLDPRSDAAEAETVLEAARNADVILLSLFVRARSGAGRIAIPDVALSLIPKLLALGKPVVAISFGSPYLIRDLPALKTYLCAWGIQEVVQRAAVSALFGEAAIGGKLPVTIPGIARRGDGIERPASRP